MNCWKILGLDATRDKTEIKRAFAKKLKENPPDKDAAAYQRIREAYNLALKISEYVDDEEPFDEDDEYFKEEDSGEDSPENQSDSEEDDDESDDDYYNVEDEYDDEEYDSDESGDDFDEDENFFAETEISDSSGSLSEINRLRSEMHFEKAATLSDLAGRFQLKRWYFNKEQDDIRILSFLFTFKLLVGIPGIIIFILWTLLCKK